jgi:hypothetical protein
MPDIPVMLINGNEFLAVIVAEQVAPVLLPSVPVVESRLYITPAYRTKVYPVMALVRPGSVNRILPGTADPPV